MIRHQGALEKYQGEHQSKDILPLSNGVAAPFGQCSLMWIQAY
jgi:hypothetical protein